MNFICLDCAYLGEFEDFLEDFEELKILACPICSGIYIGELDLNLLDITE